ncbi:galactose-1-phosphate uridylyltransferase [Chloroflexota bacterium]
MSEIRQDPTTSYWVIFAAERGKRPKHMPRKTRVEELPEWDKSCPFCPGNESQTPGELLRYPSSSKSSSWSVRVVPNAFPAVTMNGSIERKEDGRLFRKIDAVGVHEVIIESPSHNTPMALMDYDQVEQILKAYLARHTSLKEYRALKYITIFKNQGWVAGTSLVHPHSQLIATPIAAHNYRRSFEIAVSYYDNFGECLYCRLFNQELEKRDRVVADTERFMVFHPYASHTPFETWIVPKKHCASFGGVPVEELSELARVLKNTLFGIYQELDNPSFNYMIFTSTLDDADDPYYHWYIKIVPRLTTIAGFEMGSGMYINTTFPEETARIMRRLYPV